jgi:hypothetical protein
MARLVKHAVGRWQDRAAVRAEQQLDPTLRRRFDRLPQRLADRRALRAERRLRRRSADDIERALAESWGKAIQYRGGP